MGLILNRDNKRAEAELSPQSFLNKGGVGVQAIYGRENVPSSPKSTHPNSVKSALHIASQQPLPELYTLPVGSHQTLLDQERYNWLVHLWTKYYQETLAYGLINGVSPNSSEAQALQSSVKQIKQQLHEALNRYRRHK